MRQDLIKVYIIRRGMDRVDGKKRFPMAEIYETRRHGFTVKHRRFRGDLRNNVSPTGWLETAT